jgi:hypothetical protein
MDFKKVKAMMDNISTNINKPTKDHPSSKPLTGGEEIHVLF